MLDEAELDDDDGVEGDDGAAAEEDDGGIEGLVDEELDEDGGGGVEVDVVDDSRWHPAAASTSASPSTNERLRFNMGPPIRTVIPPFLSRIGAIGVGDHFSYNSAPAQWTERKVASDLLRFCAVAR